MKSTRLTRMALGALAILTLAVPAFFFLRSRSEAVPLTATLHELEGQVDIRREGRDELTQAQDGDELRSEEELLTGQDGHVRLDLSSGTIIRVASLTTFSLQTLQQTEAGPVTRLKVAFGELWVILAGGTLDADTPSGVASVRGSFMSVFVDQETSEAFVTCLEGNCEMATNAGSLSMLAGQTASVPDLDSPPTPGVMDAAMIQRWLEFNPEATAIIPAVTATARALSVHVELPDLACFEDGTCPTYCAPAVWDLASGKLPEIKQLPQDCINAGLKLAWQGVVPELFLPCILLGGDPQACADNSKWVVKPSTPEDILLPDLSCVEEGTCDEYCAPPGWEGEPGENPPWADVRDECIDGALAIIWQGIDPFLFIRCYFSGEDLQTCAFEAVIP